MTTIVPAGRAGAGAAPGAHNVAGKLLRRSWTSAIAPSVAAIVMLSGCAPAEPSGGTGAGSGGATGSQATGGSPGSGGATRSGGSPGSGGTVGGGGSVGTGGAGQGGSVGTGGRGGAGVGVAGSSGTGGRGAGGRVGTGGSAVGGATGVAGAGGDSLCAPGRFIVCEGFETTTAGTNVAPAGWTRAGAVDVIADAANVYRGLHALRMNAAASGARRITKTGAEITALGGNHWGRIFYKVQTPAPMPATGVVHSTLVAGLAASPATGVPGNGNNEVRVVDTVEDMTGHHQFLYNVQRQGATNEFGKGSPYNWTYDGRWHCAEWHVDFATQSYHFYFDGAEITQIAINNGAGVFTNSEIPMVFMSMSVGWNNYQTSTPGFVAWIDEIAMDTSRIGCGN